MKNSWLNSMREKWNSSNKLAFVLEVLLLVFTLVLCINNIYSPRAHKIFVLLGLLYYDVKVYHHLADEKAYKFLLEIPLCLGFVLYCTFLLSVLFPTHMPWEYQKDMVELRKSYETRLYFFPEKIPDSARGTKWVVQEGFMQGTPYEILYFYADKEYIEDVVAAYGENATILEWEAEYGSWKLSFPGMDMIQEGTEEYVNVYVLHCDENVENYHIYGFYVNEDSGAICYFSE